MNDFYVSKVERVNNDRMRRQSGALIQDHQNILNIVQDFDDLASYEKEFELISYCKKLSDRNSRSDDYKVREDNADLLKE